MSITVNETEQLKQKKNELKLVVCRPKKKRLVKCLRQTKRRKASIVDDLSMDLDMLAYSVMTINTLQNDFFHRRQFHR